MGPIPENNLENTSSNGNQAANNNQSVIAGAILLAGVIIAGAIMLKGGSAVTQGLVKKESPVFNQCLDSGKYLTAVSNSKTMGSKAGVSGTPKGFILVDGETVATIDGAESGETVMKKIDSALASGGAPLSIQLDPITDTDFVLGNSAAKVTLVMYEDFQCPFCERFFNDAEQSIRSSYVKNGTVRLVYRDFAFLGRESTQAAQAARCAADQGKFWEYHDYLYTHQMGENQGAFSDLNLKSFASALGLK